MFIGDEAFILEDDYAQSPIMAKGRQTSRSPTLKHFGLEETCLHQKLRELLRAPETE